MQTREDILGDGYGYIPRPTDQRVNFSLFFQDYLPGNPTWKMHLAAFYGSRLPTGPPNSEPWQMVFRMPPYRRIDIGLSKSLITNKLGNRRMAAGFISDLWFSAEVFNLFGFNNQASYQWVRTVSNQEGIPNMFAVPNYLTGRLLNLRLTVKF